MGSVPAGGPIVDEFFSTVRCWFFDMCMIALEHKAHLPFRIVDDEIIIQKKTQILFNINT